MAVVSLRSARAGSLQRYRSSRSPRPSMTRIYAPTHIKDAQIAADRFAVGERNVKLPVAMQDEATINVGGGIAGIGLDGLIGVGIRPIMAVLFVPDQAAVAVEFGVGGA